MAKMREGVRERARAAIPSRAKQEESRAERACLLEVSLDGYGGAMYELR